MFEIETKELKISDEVKYHKECKTPLSLALFMDDKGNHIVMNSEERTSDKAKKYFEKLKNYMSDYTDCELNYYETYYDGEKNDGCFNTEETEEIIRLILLKDTKELYLDLFEESRINYNNKQTREDRKIDNYFNKIANDNKHDLAVEIIIELGDMNYWSDKTPEEKYKMVGVFKNQVVDLEKIVPSFKIANATIHFDESSHTYI